MKLASEMTMREYIAALIVQGFVANSGMYGSVEKSVGIADDLIAQLNKQTELNEISVKCTPADLIVDKCPLRLYMYNH